MIRCRSAISNVIAAGIVVIIIIVAGAAAFLLTTQSRETTTSTIFSTAAVTSTVIANSSAFPTSPSNLATLAKNEGGSLTIYSIEDPTSFSLHTWPAFQQLFPWAKVNFVPLDPGSLVSRPIAEYKSGHVTADIDWWGLSICQQLDQAGVVQHYDLSALEKQEGYSGWQISPIFTPALYAPIVLFYNTNKINASDVPSTYQDLANPMWKGKIALANPVNNDTPGAVYAGMYQSINDNATWTSIMKGIAANEVPEPFGGQAYTDVSQGQYPMGMDTLNDVITGIAAGLPIAIDWKISTVYLVSSGQCIMKGAPHPSMAQLFAEWEISAASASARIGAGFLPSQPGALNSTITALIPSNVTANTAGDVDYILNYSRWVSAYTPIFGTPG